MADSLWRLAWALPLVLAVGVAAMWALKRLMLTPSATRPNDTPALQLVQTQLLADGCTAHLLQLQDRQLLVVQGTAGVTALELGPQRSAARTVHPWLRKRGAR
jgi:flagellar biogenesis protein FliO